MKNPLIVVIGPTASGKTKLAVALAHDFHAEIVSADSRQVFKGMDIGTGKDLREYKIGIQQIPYHLIDILEPGERYHVSAFLKDCRAALEDIGSRGRLPILCGGTGMYIQALLQNYNLTDVPVNSTLREQLRNLTKNELQEILAKYPERLRETADQSTAKRLIRAIEVADYLSNHDVPEVHYDSTDPLVIGINPLLETRRANISRRLDERLASGLVEEVESLIQSGVSKEMLTFYGLEYKFVAAYLSGMLNYQQFRDQLCTAINQYAKRQMTFFRKMEKDGIKIHWLDHSLSEHQNLAEAKSLIQSFLATPSH